MALNSPLPIMSLWNITRTQTLTRESSLGTGCLIRTTWKVQRIQSTFLIIWWGLRRSTWSTWRLTSKRKLWSLLREYTREKYRLPTPSKGLSNICSHQRSMPRSFEKSIFSISFLCWTQTAWSRGITGPISQATTWTASGKVHRRLYIPQCTLWENWPPEYRKSDQ